MPKFKPDDPTTRPLPQALPLAPTVQMTDEIRQPDRSQPQRSFTSSYGDTRRDFPGPLGAETSGYPSTATAVEPMTQPVTAVEPMTQPVDPKVNPIIRGPAK